MREKEYVITEVWPFRLQLYLVNQEEAQEGFDLTKVLNGLCMKY